MNHLDYESREPPGPRLWPGPVVVAVLVAVFMLLGWLFWTFLR